MSARKISMRVFISLIICSILITVLPASDSQASFSPKNIIIMIGDGMGYNQSLATSYYRFGAAYQQVYYTAPVQYAMSTYSVDGWGYDPAQAWNDFEYMKTQYTDSAAAATAMATGVKTYDAGIGVDTDGIPVANIFEAAEAKGKSSGVVTTVEISHATPAGFVAHNASRDNYQDIANEMIWEADTDVIMGTGNPWFDNDGHLKAVANTYKYVGGQPTWDALEAGTVSTDVDHDGYPEPATLIQTKAEFLALKTGLTPERVIGVTQVYESLQQRRSGDAMADPYVVALNSNVPLLADMALGAINVLDNNPNGFVLMIEGGAIDWASHSNQPGRTIEEQADFDHAVYNVVSWVNANSNWDETLLIVTGDHESGYLWGPGSNPDWVPVVNHGKLVLPGMQFNSPNHTNSLVPFFAAGKGASLFAQWVVGTDPHRGNYIDNTSIARVIFTLINPDKLFLPVIER